jgi:hypothetical protein
MTKKLKNGLVAVVTDLRWILKTRDVSSDLLGAIETIESAVRDIPNHMDCAVVTARDACAEIFDCVHREEDAGNSENADRMRRSVSAVLPTISFFSALRG